jgi:peroxiredoxin
MIEICEKQNILEKLKNFWYYVEIKKDRIVKSINHVILNEVRMKNLSQLSMRFFPESSGLPQNDSFGSFYETIKKEISMRNKYVLPTVAIFVIVFWSLACGQKKAEPTGMIGSEAAEFSLINLSGEEVTLDQFKGKVIILNFWASWCGPCKMEIPDFIKMYNKHQRDGLEIIGITLSSGSAASIRQFAEKFGINYTVLTGDEKYLQDLTNKYGGIRGVPTTFLIDREGIIRQKWVGARTERIFMKEIDKYISD